jgi:hypothetical protein
MSFFKSNVVRSEVAEISQLQEEIYKSVFNFSSMTKEEKIKHVEILEQLLQKQKVLYTRLSLSDDPEAKDMKEKISQSAVNMGLPAQIDMNIIFDNMSKMLLSMKRQIEEN